MKVSEELKKEMGLTLEKNKSNNLLLIKGKIDMINFYRKQGVDSDKIINYMGVSMKSDIDGDIMLASIEAILEKMMEGK